MPHTVHYNIWYYTTTTDNADVFDHKTKWKLCNLRETTSTADVSLEHFLTVRFTLTKTQHMRVKAIELIQAVLRLDEETGDVVSPSRPQSSSSSSSTSSASSSPGSSPPWPDSPPVTHSPQSPQDIFNSTTTNQQTANNDESEQSDNSVLTTSENNSSPTTPSRPHRRNTNYHRWRT